MLQPEAMIGARRSSFSGPQAQLQPPKEQGPFNLSWSSGSGVPIYLVLALPVLGVFPFSLASCLVGLDASARGNLVCLASAAPIVAVALYLLYLSIFSPCTVPS